MLQYAWAAGHDVALASLTNIANELRPHNYRTLGGAKLPVGIRSGVLEFHPVRRRTLDNREHKSGTTNHQLEMVITSYAYDYVMDTYLSAATSAAMTFYLPRHELASFVRCNGYLVEPSAARGEIEYLRQHILRVRWPLNGLEAL